MLKRRISYIIFITALVMLAAFTLFSCFSSYRGDTGNLVINLGGMNSRFLIGSAEAADFEHEIILNGPGGRITKKFSGSGAGTFELLPGKWNIKVRSKGPFPNEPMSNVNKPSPGDWTLRALGWKTVDIRPGQVITAAVDMLSAIEVDTWGDLNHLIVEMPNSGREVIFVIKGELTANFLPIDIHKEITIIAEEKDATIKRDSSYTGPIFQVGTTGIEGAVLKLIGDDGGNLYIDGSNSVSGSNISSIIEIHDENILEMHDNVFVQNNNSDGSNIASPSITVHGGNFYMYGGTISNSKASLEAGGVAVYSGATFSMHGGTISNNSSGDTGGGVYASGKFYMYGGTISCNYADYGGGVFVSASGKFTKTGGGTIYGSEVSELLANYSLDDANGHAVYVTKVGTAAGEGNRPGIIMNNTIHPNTDLNSETSGNW